jgi:hypothetical protein
MSSLLVVFIQNYISQEFIEKDKSGHADESHQDEDILVTEEPFIIIFVVGTVQIDKRVTDNGAKSFKDKAPCVDETEGSWHEIIGSKRDCSS